MKLIHRRAFLKSVVVPLAGTFAANPFSRLYEAAQGSGPTVHFPSAARDRIAIASYPFREFIVGKSDSASPVHAKMALKDFPAHVVTQFAIHKIEPWSAHFLSLESSYLEDLRNAAGKAGVSFANVAADGDHSLYSDVAEERERASQFYKQWIGVAAALGSPSVRTNISPAHNAKPDVRSLAERLKPIAERAASQNIVVHLENDNPVSEDPFVLVEILDRVNSPWLRALPDFGNSLGALPAEDAYRGLDLMFARSYGVSHVKNLILSEAGRTVSVDMERVFALAAKHNYKGYFSMEWDTEGPVYEGTSRLIAATLTNLS